MNKQVLLKLEHALLANPLKFNLSSFMSSANEKHWDINDITMEKFHSCGTSACIIGHLATIVNFDTGFCVSNWFADILEIKDRQEQIYLSIACALSGNEKDYWGVRFIVEITNLMAADLIRHMRLHDTVPPSFQRVEKFYTLVEINPAPIGILYLTQNKSLQNIIGVGTDTIQATADYSEQCANYLALVENLDVAHISATL